MRRQSRIRRGERGQSSVLAALLTIVLAMGMAMMVNVSKLVTEKIAMQNATDMAVYSGAATEAGYLNKMRAENQKLWQIISDARDVLTEQGTCDNYCSGYQLQNRTATFTGTFATATFNDLFLDPSVSAAACDIVAHTKLDGFNQAPQANAYIQLVKTELLTGQAEQNLRNWNTLGFQQGTNAAKAAAAANYPGTDNRFQRYDQPAGNGMVALQQVNINLSYRGYCIDLFGNPVASDYASQTSVSGWFYKGYPNNQGDVGFVGAIRDAHPQDPYIDVGSGVSTYFSRGTDQGGSCGGSSGVWSQISTYLPSLGRCGITTFAAAVPYYGKLGSIENGNAPWEQQGQDFWNEVPAGTPSNTLDSTGRLSKHKPKGGGVPYLDYKTRFIGVFDSNLNYNAGGGAKPPQGTGDLSFTQQRPIWH